MSLPRKKLIKSSQYVYHITSRSNSKEWFYLPSSEVWKICLDLLMQGHADYGIEIHAFVLMNNHYHLMARFPQRNIDKFMQFFNRHISLRINQSSGRINHVFGGPYKWSKIHNERYYLNAIKYLYQNPLRAGLCKSCENYPYSTLKDLVRKKKVGFAVKHYLESIDLDWINEVYIPEEAQRIRNGLRRAKFQPSYEKSSRKHKTIM